MGISKWYEALASSRAPCYLNETKGIGYSLIRVPSRALQRDGHWLATYPANRWRTRIVSCQTPDRRSRRGPDSRSHPGKGPGPYLRRREPKRCTRLLTSQHAYGRHRATTSPNWRWRSFCRDQATEPPFAATGRHSFSTTDRFEHEPSPLKVPFDSLLTHLGFVHRKRESFESALRRNARRGRRGPMSGF
jgi:hypothetical protein